MHAPMAACSKHASPAKLAVPLHPKSGLAIHHSGLAPHLLLVTLLEECIIQRQAKRNTQQDADPAFSCSNASWLPLASVSGLAAHVKA